jgi:hypothetical protein
MREHTLALESRVTELETENARLVALINNPHTNSFLDAVRLEAAHQRERWKADHDAGKTDADWFWLIGYLAGKALHKPEKQLHHIITTAAACLNWHMARTVGNDMRPGTSQSDASADHG